jgi:hypothetical protein
MPAMHGTAASSGLKKQSACCNRALALFSHGLLPAIYFEKLFS